ncbi:VOC family protein [Amycolatopsis sp. FBCC-B4732]|uniref:VOC family protein n=1 Tax=Amycolatopsis sp. FBCC-B4732 TaxID=3079339 RepID=UPI001FF23AAB|nr:VOC family protein [Amycolatopsis sp. FBCC-B4732]UOX87111.1 VOC family protein [Amycolatopsis sp. FBCC-B4732]
MPEPFDALRRPSARVEPDPDFAAELRDNLRRSILNGADVTTTSEAPAATAALRSLTPYLAVSDARAALDFYVEVFGAVRRGEPILMDDGRVGHAELAIGDAVLMLAEEYPEIGHVAPREGGASVRVEVPDPDVSVARALERGATLIRAVSDSPYGRGGSFRDPFGQRWLVSQATVSSPAPSPGAAMYFTFQVPEAEPAKSFYGAVLGWQFTPGSVSDAWGFSGPGLEGGLWAGDRQVGWKLMYAVDDLAAALTRVRESGGQAGEVENHPYGTTADCTDNQGIEFWLWEKPGK